MIHVSGDVGGDTFTGVAIRDRLEPDETWEWSVSFGEKGDVKDVDSVENVVITTQAEYSG